MIKSILTSNIFHKYQIFGLIRSNDESAIEAVDDFFAAENIENAN